MPTIIIEGLATYHFAPSPRNHRPPLGDELAELLNSTPSMGFHRKNRIDPVLFRSPDHLCPGGVG